MKNQTAFLEGKSRVIQVLVLILLCLIVSAIIFSLVHGLRGDILVCVESSLLLHSKTFLIKVPLDETGSLDTLRLSQKITDFTQLVKEELEQVLNKWQCIWAGILVMGMVGSYYIGLRLGTQLTRPRSQLKQEEREQEHLFRTYGKVFHALTEGHLSLLTPEEYEVAYANEQPLLSLEIRDASDVRRCRQSVDQLLKKELPNWTSTVGHRILLCLSEAVTNVVKHTPGGRLEVILDDKGPRFHVIDDGSGLDLNKLPYIFFVKGYSTDSESIGCGFPIIMRYMSKVLVCTSKAGTKLVLYSDLKKLASETEPKLNV